MEGWVDIRNWLYMCWFTCLQTVTHPCHNCMIVTWARVKPMTSWLLVQCPNCYTKPPVGGKYEISVACACRKWRSCVSSTVGWSVKTRNLSWIWQTVLHDGKICHSPDYIWKCCVVGYKSWWGGTKLHFPTDEIIMAWLMVFAHLSKSNSRTFKGHTNDIHRVPKLAAPLFQTCLTQFVVHGCQRNIVHCTTFTIVAVAPIMTYALSVRAHCNVIITSEFVCVIIHSMHCYWQRNQAAVYLS